MGNEGRKKKGREGRWGEGRRKREVTNVIYLSADRHPSKYSDHFIASDLTGSRTANLAIASSTSWPLDYQAIAQKCGIQSRGDMFVGRLLTTTSSASSHSPPGSHKTSSRSPLHAAGWVVLGPHTASSTPRLRRSASVDSVIDYYLAGRWPLVTDPCTAMASLINRLQHAVLLSSCDKSTQVSSAV